MNAMREDTHAEFSVHEQDAYLKRIAFWNE